MHPFLVRSGVLWAVAVSFAVLNSGCATPRQYHPLPPDGGDGGLLDSVASVEPAGVATQRAAAEPLGRSEERGGTGGNGGQGGRPAERGAAVGPC